MSSVPGTTDPIGNRIRRLRRREQGVFGPVRQGGIGFNQQNPLGGSLPADPARLQELQLQVQQAQTPEERDRLIGLLGSEAQDIQERQQSGSDFLPVLTQFAQAGVPLPGPVAAIQGTPSFTGAGPDPRSQVGIQPSAPTAGPGGVPQGNQTVQPVNNTGLTVGGPATAASLARLAPSRPLNNPLRNTHPA